MGVFGGAGEYDLKESARHSSVQNSLIYRQQALTDYNVHKMAPTPGNYVSEWKPILINQTSGNTLRLSSMGGYTTRPIAEVPDYFVNDILGVAKVSLITDGSNSNEQHFRFRQVLIDRARSYIPIDSPTEELTSFMARFPLEDSNRLNNIISRLVAEHVKRILETKDPALIAAMADTCTPAAQHIESSDASSPLNAAPLSAFAAPVTLPKRKQSDEVADRNDLVGREKIKDLESARLKLEAMIRLAEEKADSSTPLTGKAKTWASRYLTPVMGCLQNHFGNDSERFLAEYPDYHPNSFSHKHCKGKGSHCHF